VPLDGNIFELRAAVGPLEVADRPFTVRIFAASTYQVIDVGRQSTV
jgi:hypothetical protein